MNVIWWCTHESIASFSHECISLPSYTYITCTKIRNRPDKSQCVKVPLNVISRYLLWSYSLLVSGCFFRLLFLSTSHELGYILYIPLYVWTYYFIQLLIYRCSLSYTYTHQHTHPSMPENLMSGFIVSNKNKSWSIFLLLSTPPPATHTLSHTLTTIRSFAQP